MNPVNNDKHSSGTLLGIQVLVYSDWLIDSLMISGLNCFL